MPNTPAHPRLALYELGWLHLQTTQECNRLLHEMNFPVQMDQAPIVIFLYYREAASQQEMAQALQRDKASVNRTVTYLSRNSLVSVEPDEQDGRKTVVKLTPAGKRIANELETILAKFDATLTAGLTPEERQQLSFLLNKLTV